MYTQYTARVLYHIIPIQIGDNVYCLLLCTVCLSVQVLWSFLPDESLEAAQACLQAAGSKGSRDGSGTSTCCGSCDSRCNCSGASSKHTAGLSCRGGQAAEWMKAGQQWVVVL